MAAGGMPDALDAPDDLLGRFWPAPPRRTDARFDVVGTPYVVVVRHVPTDAVMETARIRFGDAAVPLLAAWRDAWETAVGPVDAFVARVRPGQVPPEARAAADAKARDTLADLSPDLAAARLFARAKAAIQANHRDEAFHVLEDALQVTALISAGVACDLVLDPMAITPTVLCAPVGPGRSLALLDWRGCDAEQDRHAAACRRARALCEAVNPYWESPVFRSLCGREMTVAATAPHLAAILRDMALAGHAKAFLKSTAPKGGTWVADLAGVHDVLGAAMAAHAAMGHSYADIEGVVGYGGPGILVQGFVPFTHEHRFLIVGHRIVASTASDRDLSVLDRHRGRIVHPGVARLRVPASDRGAYDRGGADTVVDRDMVAAMARTARAVVRGLRREGIVPDCYCLDIGLSERGVLPIEVNTAVRCGLYAVGWERFAAALARTQAIRAELSPAGSGTDRRARDSVEDAFAFMLDTLCDQPPRLLTELGRRLVEMGEEPEKAVAAGRLFREEHARESDDPLDTRAQGALEVIHGLRVDMAELGMSLKGEPED